MGKGRKERITPIWKSTAAFIDNYIKQQNLNCDNHLLVNNRKGNLTRSGVGQRITTITEKAVELPPSLNKKNVTLHTFRHSAAMNLLQAGVDISTIAIWQVIDTINGATSSAIIYSIAETAKANNLKRMIILNIF